MSHILVPIDFVPTSANALRYCINLADDVGKELVLLHIIYPEFEMLDLPVFSLQSTREKVSVAREKLQSLVDQTLMQIQVDHDLKSMPILRADIEVGTPGPMISGMADRDEVELLIMGMRDKHYGVEQWFGGVTKYAMTRTSKAMMVLPHNAEYRKPKKILFASDFTKNDREGIRWIKDKMGIFSPAIDLIHIHAIGETVDAGVYSEQLNQLDKIRSEFDDVQLIDKGAEDLTQGILEYAESFNYDLLAVFSPKRSWWDRLTHQSISKKIIEQSTRPVLILK